MKGAGGPPRTVAPSQRRLAVSMEKDSFTIMAGHHHPSTPTLLSGPIMPPGTCTLCHFD